MNTISKKAVHAVLSVGFLLVAATPGTAADRIGSGAGAYVGQNQETKVFGFSVSERSDGSVRGYGIVIEPGSRGYVLFEISSYMFVGDSLGMAGEIIRTVNSPPEFAVDTTLFFFVNDNNPDTDEFAGPGLVPPELGHLTIQEIVALIGPPPPFVYQPLLAGNVRIY